MGEREQIRLKVYFSGNVQGVGFRYTAYRVAARYRVAGYVKNLKDGRVELVVEGEASEVERFLTSLNEIMKSYIIDEERQQEMYLGEFRRFEIAY